MVVVSSSSSPSVPSRKKEKDNEVSLLLSSSSSSSSPSNYSRAVESLNSLPPRIQIAVGASLSTSTSASASSSSPASLSVASSITKNTGMSIGSKRSRSKTIDFSFDRDESDDEEEEEEEEEEDDDDEEQELDFGDSTSTSMGQHQQNQQQNQQQQQQNSKPSFWKSLKDHSLNFPINTECTSVSLSTSGNFLWAGFSDGTIRVFDVHGKFGMEHDTIQTDGRRNKTTMLVASKWHQTFGAVACQIHARGVHTDLLTHVDIASDEYVFGGVQRGAMELYAIPVAALEKAARQKKLRDPSKNILDFCSNIQVHSHAKLKGFGACTKLHNASRPTYLLLTGKGIKNIHIWRFQPPLANDPDKDSDGIWEQIYDTQTNGNTINLLSFYRSPITKHSNSKNPTLWAISKSDSQKLRMWDLSAEEDGKTVYTSPNTNTNTNNNTDSENDSEEEEAADASGNAERRPKRPPYKDVVNSKEALGIAGGFCVCGGPTMYNQLSIVSLDRPKDDYNHTELALPGISDANSSGGGYSSRRQRRGDLKQLVRVATMSNDASHALLELDDGSMVHYTGASARQLSKLTMVTPEKTGIPSLPATFWRRVLCLSNWRGVVLCAASMYNPNTQKGQVFIRALEDISTMPKPKLKKRQPKQIIATPVATSLPPRTKPLATVAPKVTPRKKKVAKSEVVTPQKQKQEQQGRPSKKSKLAKRSPTKLATLDDVKRKISLDDVVISSPDSTMCNSPPELLDSKSSKSSAAMSPPEGRPKKASSKVLPMSVEVAPKTKINKKFISSKLETSANTSSATKVGSKMVKPKNMAAKILDRKLGASQEKPSYSKVLPVSVEKATKISNSVKPVAPKQKEIKSVTPTKKTLALPAKKGSSKLIPISGERSVSSMEDDRSTASFSSAEKVLPSRMPNNNNHHKPKKTPATTSPLAAAAAPTKAKKVVAASDDDVSLASFTTQQRGPNQHVQQVSPEQKGVSPMSTSSVDTAETPTSKLIRGAITNFLKPKRVLHQWSDSQYEKQKEKVAKQEDSKQAAPRKLSAPEVSNKIPSRTLKEASSVDAKEIIVTKPKVEKTAVVTMKIMQSMDKKTEEESKLEWEARKEKKLRKKALMKLKKQEEDKALEAQTKESIKAAKPLSKKLPPTAAKSKVSSEVSMPPGVPSLQKEVELKAVPRKPGVAKPAASTAPHIGKTKKTEDCALNAKAEKKTSTVVVSKGDSGTAAVQGAEKTKIASSRGKKRPIDILSQEAKTLPNSNKAPSSTATSQSIETTKAATIVEDYGSEASTPSRNLTREEMLSEKIVYQYKRLRRYMKSVPKHRSPLLMEPQEQDEPMRAAHDLDYFQHLARRMMGMQHLAAYEMIRKRLLRSAENSLRLTIDTYLTVEECRAELRKAIESYRDVLHDTLQRHEMEVDTLVAQQTYERRGLEVSADKVSFPFNEVFRLVEDIHEEIEPPRRLPGRPKTGLLQS